MTQACITSIKLDALSVFWYIYHKKIESVFLAETKNLMKKTLLLLTALMTCSLINAQIEPQCGTISTPESQAYFEQLMPQVREYEQEYFQLASQRRSSTAISSVPVKAHIIRNTGGFGGLTEQQLDDAMATMNAFYANAFLEFFLCEDINYIDDSTYFNFNQNQEAALTSANNVPNVINIYFANSVTTSGGAGLCGYAYFPGGPETIMMNNSCTLNGSTLSHEMGHFFALSHTHGNSNTTLTTELVDGSNCEVAGDFICDTPADPQLNNSNVNTSCIYTGSTADANGQLFAPNPNNIMSYSRRACRTELSAQQYARIYGIYQAARSVMACPSANVDINSDYTIACESSLDVDFTDNSTGAVAWQWDVDGDDVIDYTTQNPSHTYATNGIYDVTLTINTGSQSLTKVYQNYIDFSRENISTSQLILTLELDNFPEQTTWEFRNSAGTILYSDPTYVNGPDNLQTYTYNFDVTANECYTFEIFDSSNNGVCCVFGSGGYTLETLEGATVSSSDGTYGSGTSIFMGNDVLSVDDYFANNNITAYPNPTNDILNIKLSNTNDLPDSYTIYNVLGQEIIKKVITRIEDLSIQAKAFSEGVYYVKVSKGTSSSTIPFIKN